MNRQSLLVSGIALAAGGTLAMSLLMVNRTQAQAPMNGMDHSQMDHSQMMPGMNHSSMMEMDLGPADAAFDLRFIDAMIPHHQGAVVMAQEVLKKSKRPELQKLAQAIITAQDKEIKQMQDWRKAWYAKAPVAAQMWSAEMGHMMDMSSPMMSAMMMNQSLGAADAEFDLRFLEAMIPHHEAALVMANDALTKSTRPEIQNLAKAILSSQKAEIDQMKAWRKDWYKK